MSKNAKRQWAAIKERLIRESQITTPPWLYDESGPPEMVSAVAYLHELDNTEGLEGNEPIRILSFSPESPFGVPGVDHSKTYPVTTTALMPMYRKG